MRANHRVSTLARLLRLREVVTSRTQPAFLRTKAVALVSGVAILCLASAPRFLSVGSVAAQVQIEQPTAAESREWLKTLAAWPGNSLPEESPLRQQVITFFNVSEQRVERGQYFVAGRGYAEIDGGGTFSGMNRAQDPFLELTLPGGSSALEECRRLLVPATFEAHAVAVTGVGSFAEMPGARDRQLGVFRFDTLGGCKLVRRF